MRAGATVLLPFIFLFLFDILGSVSIRTRCASVHFAPTRIFFSSNSFTRIKPSRCCDPFRFFECRAKIQNNAPLYEFSVFFYIHFFDKGRQQHI